MDIYKFGWTRVNFNYFISDTELNYIINAVDFVATHGWKFLPLYQENGNGLFSHKKKDGVKSRYDSLYNISYKSGKMAYKGSHTRAMESSLKEYMYEAYMSLNTILNDVRQSQLNNPADESMVGGKFDWWLTATEALAKLRKANNRKSIQFPDIESSVLDLKSNAIQEVLINHIFKQNTTIKELFQKLDQKKVGHLTFLEFYHGLRTIITDIPETDCMKIFLECDINNSGTIDLLEFQRYFGAL